MLDNSLEDIRNQQTALLLGNDFQPSEIEELKKVQSLDLFLNKLTSLPAEIGELKNLTKLDLRGNQLTSLPAAIGNLHKLEALDLSDFVTFDIESYEEKAWRNRLTHLPAEIRQMKSLGKMDLSENPFSLRYITQLRKDMPWCEVVF